MLTIPTFRHIILKVQQPLLFQKQLLLLQKNPSLFFDCNCAAVLTTGCSNWDRWPQDLHSLKIFFQFYFKTEGNPSIFRQASAKVTEFKKWYSIMKFLLILVLILAPIQIYGQIYTIQVNEYQSNGWEYKVRADPFTDEIISTVSKAAKDGPDTSVSKPILYIRSNGDIYVDWKRFISKNNFDQPTRYRFDKGEIETIKSQHLPKPI